jgi:hypothetical protein
MKSEKILLMLLTLLSSLSFYAQEKLDKIIKKNYDIIECKI